ncbi:conserved hypothetical protein [Methanocella arvoryzae MRE50]|uniref:Glycosyltransferase RgtA/B/C/D-like domain-containing protein n=2 Tax=Methanocella TaxID=570266 RepID=Q0W3E1_METAR|nr:conserved hypothetical protein [Methanocella arvoryzae MRE50]
MYLLPIIGIAGIVLTTALGQTNFLILSLYLVIPLLLVSILFRSLSTREESTSASLDEGTFRLLLVAYLLCYSLSAILLTVYDLRPLAYFLIITTMTITVLIQIMKFSPTRERIALVLLQIMGLVANLNLGVTLKYFRFIGRTDVMIHNQYVNSVVQTGHVTEVFFDYQAFPLWHILNAIIYMIGDGTFPTDKVMAITGCIIFLCLPLLAYLVAIRLFKDQKTAMIAALLAFFFPNITYWSISGISSAVAVVLIAFILYLAVDGRQKYCLLLIALATLAVIVYHSVSIIFALFILGSLYVVQKVLMKKDERLRRINFRYLALTVGATLAYWYFFGPILLQELYNNIVLQAPSGIVTKSVVLTPLSEIFNYLQYSPAVLFILTGALVILLSSRFNVRAKLFAVVAFMFIWITFPGPLYLFNKLLYNFSIDRFAEYTPFLLAIVSSAGIAALLTRSNKYVKACIILLFAVWVMLSITNDWVASDNPLVKRPFYTYYLTQDEIAGFDRIAVGTTAMIQADFITTRYLDSTPYDPQFNILEVAGDKTDFYKSSPDDIILIRNAELEKRPLKLSTNNIGEFKRYPRIDTYDYYYKDSEIWANLGRYDQVYDSARVSGYI